CRPPPGLVVHLPLDEREGLAARDLSGRGNDGALAGLDAPRWVAGRVVGAVDLDGHQVDLGSAASIDDLMTLTNCAWIRPRSYPSEFPTIADKSADTFVGGWNFYIHTAGTFGLLTNRRQYAEAGGVRLGAWQHLCASWDGSDGASGIALYRDGALRAHRETGSNGTGLDKDAARDLILGRVNSGAYAFDGLIDDVQLYGRVLTHAEIVGVFDYSFLLRCARRRGAPG